MAKYYDDSKLTYQQIVMRQIKIIQDISSKELRDSTKTIKNLIGEQTLEAEDTRYSYLQSIDMLGSLLFPYFPEKKENAEDINSSFDEFTELYDLELVKAIDDEDFIKELGMFFDEEELKEKIENDEGLRTQVNVYFLNYKIKVARKIFRELVKLFKDLDFLSSENYGDSGGESDDGMDAEDIDDGEAEE